MLLAVLRDRAITASQHELETVASALGKQSRAAFQSLELVQTSVIERIQALGITSSEQYEQRMSDYATHLLLKDKIVAAPTTDHAPPYDWQAGDRMWLTKQR